MTSGRLFVISGPSGVGKGTICKVVLEEEKATTFSVSMTTRSPREGEVHGEDYFFVSKEEFEKLMAEGGLLETNNFCDNYYGTPKKYVVDQLQQGIDVLLEIDYHGAFQVKAAYPEAILIFIMPPSIEELRERIIARGSEDEESLNKRLAQAEDDLSHADEYDYRVVNDDLDRAVADVREIMKSERNKEE